MAQVVVARHQVAGLIERLAQVIIAGDIFGHAVGDQHQCPGLAFGLPEVERPGIGCVNRKRNAVHALPLLLAFLPQGW